MDFQNPTPGQGPDQMPYGTPNPPQGPVYVQSAPVIKENSMATAAMVLGIASGISTFLLPFELPCIFGGISIVLAFLSKGSKAKLSARAKTGFITSLCSVILNFFILAGCFYLVFNVPEFQEAFDEAYEQLYGESFYESFEEPFFVE